MQSTAGKKITCSGTRKGSGIKIGRMRIRFPGFLLAVLLAAGNAQDANPGLVTGDPAAGASKYKQVCEVCHGPGGNSIIAAQPILAGQHPEYTAAQLVAYADGSRPNAIMASFAAGLSETDIANIAVYLAAQQAGLSGATDPTKAAAGQKLYLKGSGEAGIAACAACHGPAGDGIPPLYPKLSGQHAAYTRTTMAEFASGTRPGSVMNEIAAALSEEQIDNLAEYIAGLH